MKLAHAIRELRRSRMLSISELARHSQISKSHLFHVERERYAPSLASLEKISAGLGVGVKQLLTLNSTGIVLEDDFVQRVRPFLPRLTSEQRTHLLRTLRAAPKRRLL